MTTRASRYVIKVVLQEDAFETPIAVDAPRSATVSALLQELLEVGIMLVPAPGLSVWGGRVSMPATATLDSMQLYRDQRILPISDSSSMPELPPINTGESLRLIHQDGPQLGFAWPIVTGRSLLLRYDEPFWIPVDDSDGADVSIVALEEEIAEVTWLSTSGNLVLEGRVARRVRLLLGSELRIARGTDEIESFVLQSSEEHETGRSNEGLITYRVKARSDVPSTPIAAPIRVQLHPRIAPPEFHLGDLALQSSPMVAMAAALLFVTGNPIVLFTALFAVVVPLVQWIRFRRQLKKYSKDLDEWSEGAERAGGSLRARAEAEAQQILARQPSFDIVFQDATKRTGRLWQKRSADLDFLRILLGTGEYKTPSDIPYEATREVDDKWVEFFEAMRIVPGAPVEYPLAVSDVAICGARDELFSLVNSILARLVITHSPAHTALAAFLPSSLTGQLEWIKTLPHTSGAALGWVGETMRCGRAEIAETLRANHGVIASLNGGNTHLVVLAHEASGVSMAQLRALSDVAPGHVHVMWLGSSTLSVPRHFSTSIEIGDGVATLREPLARAIKLTDRVDAAMLARVARSLEPLVDETIDNARLSLPSEIPLGFLMDLESVWEDQADTGLVSTFLVDAGGPVPFDLVTEGPHALVAGMTGSGKSEFLRSLILSLAVRYPPTELAMLLVDYKGGASLGDFRDLPHCIGMVSNLTELDVARFTKFLGAELTRRQEILAPYGGEYRAYRRAKKSDLPRLVVVIDEFQGFVQATPRRDPGGDGNEDRQGAVLNVAARGRSAGMHMILATQNPTREVISSGVSANVGVSFCLKTTDEAGSINVIGHPVAATIPTARKGRLYKNSGEGHVTALQSAFTQASVLAIRASGDRVSLRIVDSPFQQRDNHAGNEETDAELLVRLLKKLPMGEEE